MSSEAAGRGVGVEALAERDDLVGVDARAELHAHRVLHAGEELDVGAVELAGAVADPQQVGRAVVPVAGQRVLAGERLLVVEQERLVAGVDVDLVELQLGVEVDAAGGHEPQRALDLGREALVAPALGAGVDELLVPRVDLGEVGEAALGEGAQQVEGGGRLVVAADQPLRVGPAGGGLELEVVHHVAAEGRQLDAVACLGGGGARLRELAGDAADLHRRHAGAVGEHHRHLEDDLQLVADGVGRERARTTRRSRPPAGRTPCPRWRGRATR